MDIGAAVAVGASGDGDEAGGAGIPEASSAWLVVVYPPEQPLLGKRFEVPSHGFRIGGDGDDFVLPGWDGTPAKITRGRVERSGVEGWRIIEASGRIKVNRETVDGSCGLFARDLIDIAGTGFVFLCGEELEAQYDELIYRLTITDVETGCHNARYFTETLERRELRATRQQLPLSVAVLDFGSSRERASLGQSMREVAGRLGMILGRDWVLARLTEHELAVIAPGATEGKLLATIETPFHQSKWPVYDQPLPRPRIGTATLSPEVAGVQLVEKARTASMRPA